MFMFICLCLSINVHCIVVASAASAAAFVDVGQIKTTATTTIRAISTSHNKHAAEKSSALSEFTLRVPAHCA